MGAKRLSQMRLTDLPVDRSGRNDTTAAERAFPRVGWASVPGASYESHTGYPVAPASHIR